MKAYPLSQLQLYLQRVIEANASEPMWIVAEVSQLNERRGHYYIDLVEKEAYSQEIKAQARAMLWAKTYRKLRTTHGELLDQLLQAERKIMIQVQVRYSARYGLALDIHDINTAYTLGDMALARQQALDQLAAEGLLDLQRRTHFLPPVMQRIAVISSEQAAGFQDFVQQLSQNPFGYDFQVICFQSAVQGEQVAQDVTSALDQIAREREDFDVIVVTRGGGSRLDLAAFDDYQVARAIATAALPVLTGIGHDRDEVVADLVAHTSLKTPTAVAEFVLAHNRQLEEGILGQVQSIFQYAERKQQWEQRVLDRQAQHLRFLQQQQLQAATQALQHSAKALPKTLRQHLLRQQQQLSYLSKNVDLLDPQQALARGYALLQQDGQVVRSITELAPGDTVTARLADGSAELQVLTQTPRTT